MNFNCDKSLLKSAVATAGKVAVSKSAVSALECLLIESTADDCITITGYDQEIGITVKVDATVWESGRFCVRARMLSDILARMPDDMISIQENNNAVSVSCGDTRFNVQSVDVEQYPALPKMDGKDGFSIPQYALKSMIDGTAFCVSIESQRPQTMGVFFQTDGDQLLAVATDGFRMSIRRETMQDNPTGPVSFIVPGTSLGDVRNALTNSTEPVSIEVSRSHVRFVSDTVTIICRLIEGDFLDYKKALPKSYQIKLQAKRADLASSIDRVSLIAGDTKVKVPVKMCLDDGKIVMTAKSAIGDCVDVCPIVGNGNQMEIGFNSKYLLEAVKNCPADNVEIGFNGPTSPAMILPEEGETESFMYMVLPVRLKPGE